MFKLKNNRLLDNVLITYLKIGYYIPENDMKATKTFKCHARTNRYNTLLSFSRKNLLFPFFTDEKKNN